MEDFLDSISRKEAGHQEYLQRFYFGDTSDDTHNVGLKPRLDEKIDEIDPRTTARFLLGTPSEGAQREEVFVRVGKYGPFLEQGERRASIPDGLPPDEMNLEKAMELLESSEVRGRTAWRASRNRQTDLCQSRPFWPLHPIGRQRRRGKAKSVAAARAWRSTI